MAGSLDGAANPRGTSEDFSHRRAVRDAGAVACDLDALERDAELTTQDSLPVLLLQDMREMLLEVEAVGGGVLRGRARERLAEVTSSVEEVERLVVRLDADEGRRRAGSRSHDSGETSSSFSRSVGAGGSLLVAVDGCRGAGRPSSCSRVGRGW